MGMLSRPSFRPSSRAENGAPAGHIGGGGPMQKQWRQVRGSFVWKIGYHYTGTAEKSNRF